MVLTKVMIFINFVFPDLLGLQPCVPSDVFGSNWECLVTPRHKEAFMNSLWSGRTLNQSLVVQDSSMGIFFLAPFPRNRKGRSFPFASQTGSWRRRTISGIARTSKKEYNSNLRLCVSTWLMNTPHCSILREEETLTDLLSDTVSSVAFSYLVKLSLFQAL